MNTLLIAILSCFAPDTPDVDDWQALQDFCLAEASSDSTRLLLTNQITYLNQISVDLETKKVLLVAAYNFCERICSSNMFNVRAVPIEREENIIPVQIRVQPLPSLPKTIRQINYQYEINDCSTGITYFSDSEHEDHGANIGIILETVYEDIIANKLEAVVGNSLFRNAISSLNDNIPSWIRHWRLNHHFKGGDYVWCTHMSAANILDNSHVIPRSNEGKDSSTQNMGSLSDSHSDPVTVYASGVLFEKLFGGYYVSPLLSTIHTVMDVPIKINEKNQLFFSMDILTPDTTGIYGFTTHE